MAKLMEFRDIIAYQISRFYFNNWSVHQRCRMQSPIMRYADHITQDFLRHNPEISMIAYDALNRIKSGMQDYPYEISIALERDIEIPEWETLGFRVKTSLGDEEARKIRKKVARMVYDTVGPKWADKFSIIFETT